MNLKDLFGGNYEINSLKDEYGRAIPNRDIDYSTAHVSRYLVKEGLKVTYPDNKNFAFLLSHDIDRLFLEPWSFKTMLNQQVKALLKGDFLNFKENFGKFKRFRYKDFSLERLVNINRKYGLRSTCFFLALEPGEKDFNYHPRDIAAEFELLKANNYEIGLHGGHEAYRDPSKLVAEKMLLQENAKQEIFSYRNHYLKFDIKCTWNHIASSGIITDGTYGWASTPGFRNGVAHLFVKDNLVIIPLHLMDTTLFVYQKINKNKILNTLNRLLDEIEEVNGCFSLLWHNNKTTGEAGEIYMEMLNLVMARNPAIMTHKECANWFKKNNYFGMNDYLTQLPPE